MNWFLFFTEYLIFGSVHPNETIPPPESSSDANKISFSIDFSSFGIGCDHGLSCLYFKFFFKIFSSIGRIESITCSILIWPVIIVQTLSGL